MTDRAVAALVRLHLIRIRRLAMTNLIMFTAATALDIVRHGLSFDSAMPWFLGSAILFPISPGFMIAREKMDGSLRYFASLPVSAAQHATARAVVAFASTLPAVAMIAIGLVAGPSHFPLLFAAVAGIGAGVALGAGSLALLASQILIRPGDGLKYMLWILFGFFIVVKMMKFASEHGGLDIAASFLKTVPGLAASSALLWVGMAFVAWASLRAIGVRTVAYRGEPWDKP